ncbi:peptidase [Actinomadura sp. NBRC 104412]|uniref:alpha/beta hydrolase n=1 Tax=Actinomadura sp. NBRC 104412 TaxID=3032203 RepID=UPI0024A354B5|nr:alpha/beta hydrolase [Actinomadura sp. NBRC 104412]GLZ04491.1 peptidase [Actinomadura sp. NBRC 104412]
MTTALGMLPGAAGAAPLAQGIDWKPCPKNDPLAGSALKGLECGTLRVPLDYARPDGEQVTLALTRARHTAPRSQGVVLLNRGGPGAQGRDMPAVFTQMLPKDVTGSYDWVGYDPRGVGASKPSLMCDPKYQNPGHAKPDAIPANAAEEQAWVMKARAYADDCMAKYGKVLPHMGTRDWVRDLEAIRFALGEKRINYFGYSYGTYLGAAYATAYPERVRRMVLDSVVRPSGVWYANNLDQNVAFEKRIHAFYRWIARHHATYGLGRSGGAVASAYARVRAALKARPLKGKLGPTELDDMVLTDGYTDQLWPSHAHALSAFAVRKDPRPLLKAFRPPGWADLNNYSVYSAVQCRDAAWPRRWGVWHADNWRLYRSGYRFETWGNAWYNAPCAFWGVPGGPPPRIGGTLRTPPLLLIQSTEDAATPYSGALETHRLFPTSRLVVQDGSGNHGISVRGDKCLDRAVIAYLRDGVLPESRPGPDAVCAAGAPPRPKAAKKSR